MRNAASRIRFTPDTTVRLLLVAIMALVLTVMLALSSGPAAAQAVADQGFGLPRDRIAAQLDAQYKEVPVAGGITANGAIVEVFAAADGGSWTIIVTAPDGTSRVIAQGEGWTFIEMLEGLGV